MKKIAPRTTNTQKFYVAAAAIMITGISLTSPVYAVPYKIDTPAQPVYADNQTVRTAPSYDYQTPRQRENTTPPTRYNQGYNEWNVEDRINSMHRELRITQDQEQQWADVASVMRMNDDNLRRVVRARHQGANSMNAVQDLESFQLVAQAHVDGLQRLILVFNDLYSDMSDAQRLQADTAFNHFEGRMSAKKHK